jgi:hypothetical protein
MIRPAVGKQHDVGDAVIDHIALDERRPRLEALAEDGRVALSPEKEIPERQVDLGDLDSGSSQGLREPVEEHAPRSLQEQHVPIASSH